MRIGDVLRTWRKAKKRTLADVSSECGITLPTLARIEKGGRMDGRTLKLLIDYLF